LGCKFSKITSLVPEYPKMAKVVPGKFWNFKIGKIQKWFWNFGFISILVLMITLGEISFLVPMVSVFATLVLVITYLTTLDPYVINKPIQIQIPPQTFGLIQQTPKAHQTKAHPIPFNTPWSLTSQHPHPVHCSSPPTPSPFPGSCFPPPSSTFHQTFTLINNLTYTLHQPSSSFIITPNPLQLLQYLFPAKKDSKAVII
jgi:hypothetical protein